MRAQFFLPGARWRVSAIDHAGGSALPSPAVMLWACARVRNTGYAGASYPPPAWCGNLSFVHVFGGAKPMRGTA